jgi:hypothetical protein
MNGGPSRPPVLEMSDEEKKEMKKDLFNTGILDYIKE